MHISSEGLYLRCQGRVFAVGWLGRQRELRQPHGLMNAGAQQTTGLQQCVGSLFRENAHHQLWFSPRGEHGAFSHAITKE